jgi:hypothetical protein
VSRFDYVTYDEKAQQESLEAKDLVTNLENFIETELGGGREQALALTKLEECFMWIGKAIRNKQISLNFSNQETSTDEIPF